MKNIMRVLRLLESGKAEMHVTYEQTGIVCVRLKKVSGSAGKDVNFAYIYQDGKVDIVSENNIHYGYGHFENDYIIDNSNRSVFEII